MRSIFITWIVLFASIAIFWKTAESLEEGAQLERQRSDRIGRMIHADERAFDVEGVSIRIGENPPLVYIHRGTEWRCVSQFDAVCKTEAVDGVIRQLMEAEGVQRSTDPARLALYGLEPGKCWRIELHDSTEGARNRREGRIWIDLGQPTESGDGCFIRRIGNPSVWEIDTNPWGYLAANGAAIAPLIDPAVLPRVWPEGTRRIDKIEVHRGGASYDILLHQRQLTTEEMRAGVPSVFWTLSDGVAEQPTATAAALSYQNFLLSARYAKLLDPSKATEWGLERPVARLVMHPFELPTGELVLGPDVNGVTAMHFVPTGGYYLMPTVAAQLLVPPVELLAEGATENPWQPYLEQAR